MEIKGKLIEKSETANVTASFKKREFVLEYAENPQYPEFVKFELIQDKCDLLDGFNNGQEINVAFNLKGRKWTDPQGVVKYFNSLQAWKLSAAHDIATKPTSKASAEPEALTGQSEPEWLQSTSGAEGDDLPF
tara:strand:+ start:717 stop:1115 length:399 start_codon:yes stop_codon:yes gene_type:complete